MTPNQKKIFATRCQTIFREKSPTHNNAAPKLNASEQKIGGGGVIACDWTGLFEVVSSKKAVVVLLIYLQEAMYNKSVDENTTNQ